MSGWIKLQRKMTEWEWFTDVNTCHLFTYLLLSATHTETKWRGVSLRPGQLVTGRTQMALKTGLSEQQIRTSLDKLKATSEITSKPFNKFSLITVTNWNLYQDSNQQNNQQLTSEITNNQPASNQQVTTFNKVKKEKKVKEKKKDMPLPDWLPLDDWEDFLEVRKKKNKVPTNRAIQMLVVKLDELRKSGHDPGEVIRQSVINGWSGFFEIKDYKNGSNSRFNSKHNAEDRIGARGGDKHQRTLEAATRGHIRAENPDF